MHARKFSYPERQYEDEPPSFAFLTKSRTYKHQSKSIITIQTLAKGQQNTSIWSQSPRVIVQPSHTRKVIG